MTSRSPEQEEAPPAIGIDRSLATILAIETAGHLCSVAAMRAGAVLAAETVVTRHDHAKLLVPMMGRVLAEAGIGAADLDLVAVGIGPGGFSGLRAGIAAALGIALVASAPVVGITAFQSAAANLPPEARQGRNLAVLVDSRREEGFFAVLTAELALDGAPELATPAQAAALLQAIRAPLLVAGDAADALQGLVGSDIELHAMGGDAIAVARLAADPKGRFDRPARPLYLRAPDLGPAKQP